MTSLTLTRKLRWQAFRDSRPTAEQETPPLEKGSCIERESINAQCLGFGLEQAPQGDLLRSVCNVLQFNDTCPCIIKSAVCLVADTS